MFDTAVNLCVEDISLFTDYVILRLKESKTDPFRKGIDIKLFKITIRVRGLTAQNIYNMVLYQSFTSTRSCT
jgi:hypothetical protein